MGKLLGYQVLDTGYCNTSIFNLGNWVITIHRIQQGNLEAAAFSMLSKVGVKLGCCDMSYPIGESGDCNTFNVQQGRGF